MTALRPVLIDATNLVTGGAVQVAVSFLTEFDHLRRDPAVVSNYPWVDSVDVHVSPAVANALSEDVAGRLQVCVELNRPLKLTRWLRRSLRYEVVFYVFGPDYASSPARRRVLGYADVRSVYGTARGEASSIRARLWWAMRGFISRSRVRRADVVVVEAEAFRQRLIERGVSAERIRVVPNTINRLFMGVEVVLPPSRDKDDVCRLLYVTRPYPHKNLPFLPRLASAMDSIGGPRLEFALTVGRNELSGFSQEFLDRCSLVGEVRVEELPALYASCDASIFPSLLESFSATPLESMACGRVVFASDREFIRDVAGDIPIYIDPLDPFAAARAISRALVDRESMRERAVAGVEYIRSHPSALDRASAYLSIIDSQLEKVGA